MWVEIALEFRSIIGGNNCGLNCLGRDGSNLFWVRALGTPDLYWAPVQREAQNPAQNPDPVPPRIHVEVFECTKRALKLLKCDRLGENETDLVR